MDNNDEKVGVAGFSPKQFELLAVAVLSLSWQSWSEWQEDKDNLSLQFLAEDYRELLVGFIPLSSLLREFVAEQPDLNTLVKQLAEIIPNRDFTAPEDSGE